MSEQQIQRQVILSELRSMPFSGVEVNLRALPPPMLGWWIEVNENNLQDFSDQRREDILMYILGITNKLKDMGIKIGIIRAPFPDST